MMFSKFEAVLSKKGLEGLRVCAIQLAFFIHRHKRLGNSGILLTKLSFFLFSISLLAHIAVDI